MRLLNPRSFPSVKTLVTALVMMSGFSQLTYAEVAPGFYQSQQDVVDQSKSTRERAIKSGFAEILVKLAGDKSIVLRPELNTLLQNPKPYLQTYSYIKDEEGDQKVRLEFNGSEIEALFSKNKLPLACISPLPVIFPPTIKLPLALIFPVISKLTADPLPSAISPLLEICKSFW